ncbi:MAG: transcription initiation protein [Acidobacteria bacterium]|nr:transcription initiation protein [Acidobacteriota bacterium]
MAKFTYLFRGDQKLLWSMSPEQMQQTMKKWMEWKDMLERGGHMQKSTERMDHAGKVVRGKAKSVTDGPYVEIKDSIGGSMVIEATDMEQAVELAKGCPILDSDGTVEIRAMIPA